MTEEYKAPDFKFVEPAEGVQGEVVAEDQIPVEAVEVASPGASEVLQAAGKELSNAMTRYFNGLMAMTTGAERSLQQLTSVLGNKLVETTIMRTYHKLADDVTANAVDTLTQDIEAVTNATLTLVLDNSEANQNVLKAAEATLDGDVTKLQNAFPADTYARVHWPEWLGVTMFVINGLRHYTDAFVTSGKAAGVDDKDIRLIISSLNVALTEWVIAFKRQQTVELPEATLEHMDDMARVTETTYTELRKTFDVRESILGTVRVLKSYPHNVKSTEVPES